MWFVARPPNPVDGPSDLTHGERKASVKDSNHHVCSKRPRGSKADGAVLAYATVMDGGRMDAASPWTGTGPAT